MKPTISIIDAELIDRILAEAKDILAKIGIEVMGAALRERLLDHGFKQDPDSGRILFPPERVEQAIAAAPGSFTLFDRAGRPHAELGGDAIHFVPGSSAVQLLDHRTGQTRPATTADFVEYVRLANADEVSSDSTRVIPGAPNGSGRWIAHHPRFQTAHLAALPGQSGLLVIPPGTGPEDLVEVLRIPAGEM